MSMSGRCAGFLAVNLLLAACGGAEPADPVPVGGAPAGGAPADGGGDSDGATDAGVRDGDLADAMPIDASPPVVCFSSTKGPAERARTAPIPGLWNARGDVDMDGDGNAEIVLFAATAAANRTLFLDARDLSERVVIETPAGESIELITGPYPIADRATPFDAAGGPSWVLLGRAVATATLYVADASTGALRATVPLSAVPESVALLTGGSGGLALVNFVGGSYRVFDLGAPDLGAGGPTGRVFPAWDFNGDGLIDVAQQLPAGVNLLDAASLEPIGDIGLEGAVLGYMPVALASGAAAPGGSDLRGSGLEVATARLEQGGIRVGYHDPESLRSRFDAVPFMADVAQVDRLPQLRFVASSQGLRLQAIEQRAAARIFKLYELSDRQGRGELGPYINLSIRDGVDVDGDAYPELELRTGPRADGINGQVSYVSAHNGVQLLQLPDERSARFDAVFVRRDGLMRLTDLDGCDGSEFLLLRSQTPNDSGHRLTRLQLHRPDGTVVFKGPAVTRRAHALALADLDADATPEVLEVIDEDLEAARLVVYGRP